MHSTAPRKIFVSTILLFLSLGMISLGMRLPYMQGVSSPAKPKPRPRAVIKTQSKTCNQIIKKIAASAAALTVPSLKLPETFDCPVSVATILPPVVPEIPSGSSRSPPTFQPVLPV